MDPDDSLRGVAQRLCFPLESPPAERCTKNMENARRETQRLSLFVLPYPVCDSRPEYFLVVFGGGLWLDVF
ncbi:hypothetical protein ANO14919_142540 [Xylariales sp. No.14919]|nr:hypothetical protein ANO14919_142540 [Xylariales sp. No.14919]